MSPKTVLAEGGYVLYQPDFLSQEQANQLYVFLKDQVAWEQKYYLNYRTGQQYPQPRLTAWYADDPEMGYSYSGVTQKVQAWIPELLELKDKLGEGYNSVLLNYYRTGQDSVGFHADDEPELDKDADIASLSLGATRKFEMIQYKGPQPFQALEFALNNGSLLTMGGTTQQYWKHAIPKQPKIMEGRINLTFRRFLWKK